MNNPSSYSNRLFYSKEVATYEGLREYEEVEYPFWPVRVRTVANLRIVVEDTLLDGLQESK